MILPVIKKLGTYLLCSSLNSDKIAREILEHKLLIILYIRKNKITTYRKNTVVI